MSADANEPVSLARRLTLSDAVAIGLGSMIGAGVFAAFAPAASAAGAGLLVGLVIAGLVAWCNATSSAQLAAQYPESGGSYVFGRERLGEWPGFLAGWAFVVGKTASCAAMALTFAVYAVPEPWQRPVAVVAVLILTGVNLLGVTRTAMALKVLVCCVLLVLLLVVVVAAQSAAGHPLPRLDVGSLFAGGWYGVLQSAGILFFAFAGYARITTLGEEVRKPAKTIPRAVAISLVAVLVVYAMLAVLLLIVVGPSRLAVSIAPLVSLVEDAGAAWAAPVVQVGAAIASLGALLALIAGVGRTALAMARNADLPRPLAAVHPKFQVPYRAEIVLALVVSVLVVSVDLRGVIGFSSFGVLLYYLVANIAAFTQVRAHRMYPRMFQVVGAAGCVTLAVTLPWQSVLGGVVVLSLGVIYRSLSLRSGARN